MKKVFSILVVVFLITACGSETKEKDIATYNFNGFEAYLQKSNDTVYIVNFWATWCKPCVKELPYFEQINADYSNDKVKVILVSLDFAENKDDLVIPFLKEKNIQSEVLILDDPDANSWIDMVDTSWSGAIPATVIYKNNSKYFHEGMFTYEELDSIVKSKL